MATRVRPSEKWQAAATGERYDRERWSGGSRARRARRDPRLVARLLADYGVTAGLVLDAACGTGRLRGAIEAAGRRWVGVDASAAMLGRALGRGDAGGPARSLVRADVERLPFADDAFDAAVACRLLHHLHGRDELVAVLRELARVTRGPLVVSFWNRASLPGWRRRLGLGRGEGPSGRVHRSTLELEDAALEAGTRPVEVRHVVPWLSQQSFAVLAKAGS